MPDTGAPWNIPYVEATDLVRDWPTDSEALADAIADGLDAAGNAGIGSNVVSVTKTDTFTTSSATPVLITDLEVSITPSSATSKVLLIFSAHISNTTASGFANTHLFRGSTQIVRGDTDTRVYGSWKNTAIVANEERFIGFSAGNFLDSPASAASVTYSLRLSKGGLGSAQVNRPGSDVTGAPRTVATLTVIEVAA